MLISILLVSALGLGLLGVNFKREQQKRLLPIKVQVRSEKRRR